MESKFEVINFEQKNEASNEEIDLAVFSQDTLNMLLEKKSESSDHEFFD
jgi:hypothetical protein